MNPFNPNLGERHSPENCKNNKPLNGIKGLFYINFNKLTKSFYFYSLVVFGFFHEWLNNGHKFDFNEA